MYFYTTVALAALPFLVVGAVPVQNSARSVLSIPLSKRSALPDAGGVTIPISSSADVETDHKMCSQLRYGECRFVSPWPFLLELRWTPNLQSYTKFHREGSGDKLHA